MKNFRFIFFFFLLFSFECRSNEIHHIQEGDTFIKAFAERMKDKSVDLKNEKIILYADPAVLSIIQHAVGVCVGIGFGALMSYCFLKEPKSRSKTKSKKMFDKAIYALCGGLSGAFGIYSGYHLINCLHKKQSKIPYLTLDDEGIVLFENPKITWKSFGEVIVEKNGMYLNDAYVGSVRNVRFIDSFGVTLLEVTENNETTVHSNKSSFLPIPMDSFILLVDHYLQNNKVTEIKIGD